MTLERADRIADEEADHQRPLPVSGASDSSARRICRREQRSGLVQQLAPRLGQLDAAARSHEKRRSEFLLKPAYLAAEHGLRDIQPLRGLAEVKPFRDRHEVAQLVEIQVDVHGAVRARVHATILSPSGPEPLTSRGTAKKRV
jgi:hypothetical protein